MLSAKKNFAVLKEQVPNFPFTSHGMSHNNPKITTKISNFYIYIWQIMAATDRHAGALFYYTEEKWI